MSIKASIVAMLLFSCNGQKLEGDDLHVEVSRILVDTSQIARMQPPSVDHLGKYLTAADYSGKLLCLVIANLSSEVIYLYSKGSYSSPFDSSLTQSVNIDSVLSGDSNIVVGKPWQINENFSTYSDSILPNSKVERLVYVGYPVTKLFGKVFYGKRHDDGNFMHYSRQIVLNFPAVK